MNEGKKAIFIVIIILICSINNAYSTQKQFEHPSIKMSLKGYLPSESEDNDKVFLTQPMAIAIDSRGNILVGDRKESVVNVFDQKGKFITKIGRRGQGPGEFLGIMKIIPYGDNFYVFDSMKHELCLFNAEGQYINSTKLFRSYDDIVVDPNGRFYCALGVRRDHNFLVDVLDKKGEYLYSFGEPIKRFNNRFDDYINQTRIAFGGNAIVLMFITIPLVQQFDLSGKLLREYAFKDFKKIKRYEEVNIKMIKKAVPGASGYWQMFHAIRAAGDSYYLLQCVGNEIEIIRLDANLRVNKIYTYQDPDKAHYLSFDFYIMNEDVIPTFYVARLLLSTRIEIISPNE